VADLADLGGDQRGGVVAVVEAVADALGDGSVFGEDLAEGGAGGGLAVEGVAGAVEAGDVVGLHRRRDGADAVGGEDERVEEAEHAGVVGVAVEAGLHGHESVRERRRLGRVAQIEAVDGRSLRIRAPAGREE